MRKSEIHTHKHTQMSIDLQTAMNLLLFAFVANSICICIPIGMQFRRCLSKLIRLQLTLIYVKWMQIEFSNCTFKHGLVCWLMCVLTCVRLLSIRPRLLNKTEINVGGDGVESNKNRLMKGHQKVYDWFLYYH